MGGGNLNGKGLLFVECVCHNSIGYKSYYQKVKDYKCHVLSDNVNHQPPQHASFNAC